MSFSLLLKGKRTFNGEGFHGLKDSFLLSFQSFLLSKRNCKYYHPVTSRIVPRIVGVYQFCIKAGITMPIPNIALVILATAKIYFVFVLFSFLRAFF